MTNEQFRDMLHRQPFQPFTIRMADGRSIDVGHPEFVALSPAGRTVIIQTADGGHRVLDLLLMTELELIKPEKRSA